MTRVRTVKMFAALALSALAVAPAAVQSAPKSSKQYNLVCQGTEQKGTNAPWTPWSETFRLDLGQRRWCRGACGAVASIDDATPDEIRLYNSRASTNGPDTVTVFSRTKGTVQEFVQIGYDRQDEIAKGQCTRAKFSGLPVARF